MSKSLEALERLGAEKLARGELIRNDSKVESYINCIKQDLERLELIEALYNKSLKEVENIKDVDRELYLKYQAFINEKEQLKNDIKLNETQIDDLTLEVANYKHALEEKNEIIMDLKENLRLTTIERTNCEDIWEEEHQKCCKLEKALDNACEIIAICPPNVNVEECEKVENECKECWKKYFLSEVSENAK